MIDTKLINKAKETSRVISAIDLSWRTFVENLKENIFTLPFKGNYSFRAENNSIYVEGYCGPLIINKLYFKHKTYLLKKTISHDPFRIYGVYDTRGRFDCFMARPEIGFHFLGMSHNGHSICTGEIQFTPPSSLDSLMEIAERIIQSFKIINIESIGTVIIPKEHEQLAGIINNRNESMQVRVEKLLTQGLIEPIL
ncbi:hypothetical protein KJ708_08645 [bacterium]|nr:hypothetical protein [bacterium]